MRVDVTEYGQKRSELRLSGNTSEDVDESVIPKRFVNK